MPHLRHALPLALLLASPAVPSSATPAPQLFEIIKSWADSAGHSRLTVDPRLSRVARANSVALVEYGGTPPAGATAFLRFLLEREAVRDAVVHGVAIHLTPKEDLRQHLSRALGFAAAGSFTHIGVGRAGDTVTVILARRLVQVAVHRGPRTEVCVSPLTRGRKPSLLVTFPDGALFERSWARGPRCFRLPDGPRGKRQVEVMVEGRYGPEVAALFPLYVGRPAPRMPHIKLYPEESREHVEILLMRLVNRARRAQGLAPLSPSRALARVARQHSQDMLEAGYFGHVSPRRGSLARRLARSGLEYSQASENLALATGPRKAHDSLMSSPSHRRTLMDPRLTHIGVGVASDPARGLLYVDQILARF